jgi:hypothetical protein
MAGEEKKRPKDNAKKGSKSKKAVTGTKNNLKDITSLSPSKQVELAADAPVYECLVPDELFEIGMGSIIISRKLANNYLGVSLFLLDVYCLGVKDTLFALMDQQEYRDTLNEIKVNEDLKKTDPACVRKLIESAEAYARDLGFKPHQDYSLSSKIFGDIDKSSCATDFTFGKDGKPLLVASPMDSPEKLADTLNRLEERCGADGYEFISLEEMFEEGENIDETSEDDDELDESETDEIVTGKVGSNLEIPAYDFFEDIDLRDTDDLEILLEELQIAFERDYFLFWEAVSKMEAGEPLSQNQREVLAKFITSEIDEDERILFIDGIPRPTEPWYEIVRKVAPHLLIEPFETFTVYEEVLYNGWSDLNEWLEDYAVNLSLPEGVKSPIEVIPDQLRHRLMIQYCSDSLYGLGQEDAMTLQKDDQHYRIEMFSEALREEIESVRFLDLTLEKLLEMVILPKKEREIFVRLMLKELKMPSEKDRLAEYL